MLVRDNLKQELNIIGREPWLKAMTLWLPLVLFFTLWWVFSAGSARDLPIGVVDFEQSALSRGLIRTYDASPTIAVTDKYTSVAQGREAMQSGDIYALVVVPNGLKKNVTQGHSPTVTTFYNSQFILIGKLVNSAMQQAQGTYNAQIAAFKNMSKGDVLPQQALAQAVPIRTQITALFNSNSHYGQFLVSATVPALWQIFIVATTVLSFAVEQRRNGVAAWLGDNPTQSVLVKLLPYTVIFFAHGMFFLWMMYGVIEWPMHGSWGILLAGQILMVIACQSIGALFFMVTQDAARSMSATAAFTAPAFAFMGITFPTSDMPTLALIWRNLLPVSHYIDIQIKQVNNGVGLDQAADKLLILSLFIGLLAVVLLIARSIVTRASQEKA